MFHNFWKQKILAPGESVDDFRECTEAERQQLQKARAEWKRPPQLLIDTFNEAFEIWWYGITTKFNRRDGQYNEETGYFEGNGILDITAYEAIRMLKYRLMSPHAIQSYCWASDIRTNIPLIGYSTGIPINSVKSYDAMFRDAKNIEVATVQIKNISAGVVALQPASSDTSIFRGCPKLRKIIGNIDLYPSQNKECRYILDCPNLEEVTFERFPNGITLYLSDMPKLNYNTYRTIINNDYTFGQGATIKTHSDVYAALTGEAQYPFNGGTQEQWQQLLEDAAEKNITFTT